MFRSRVAVEVLEVCQGPGPGRSRRGGQARDAQRVNDRLGQGGLAAEPASHARDPDRGAGGSGLCVGPGDVTGARRGGAEGIRGV